MVETDMLKDPPDSDQYEHECRIRDEFAKHLDQERPGELLLEKEHTYGEVAIRAIRGDMKTLDEKNVLRIWEFKIVAGYDGLGQILAYLAMARRVVGFKRTIRGMLAAFDFRPEITEAIEILNLGIEVVRIPPKYRLAGNVLPHGMIIPPPTIPPMKED